jgi:hypothetical protein
MSEATIAAFAVAIIAALPGILSFLNQRRKDQADITDVNQKTAITMIQQLTADNKELRTCIDELEAENDELRAKLKECK